MCDVNGGDTQLLLDGADLTAQRDTDLGIQGRKRLIQEQDRWAECQGARQSHTLLLPTGELVRIAIAKVIHMDEVEHFFHALLDLRRLVSWQSSCQSQYCQPPSY